MVLLILLLYYYIDMLLYRCYYGGDDVVNASRNPNERFVRLQYFVVMSVFQDLLSFKRNSQQN